MSQRIRIRRGESKDFREDLMNAGELAIDTDTGDVHACYEDGKCRTLADAKAVTQAQTTADRAVKLAESARTAASVISNCLSDYEVVTLTKTDDIASVESAWAIKRGDGLVWLYIQATTVATVSSATAKLFSGLPTPKRYSRAAAQMGNTNASCRVGISTDGNLYNAYTQVSAISGQPLCVNCMYFAE